MWEHGKGREGGPSFPCGASFDHKMIIFMLIRHFLTFQPFLSLKEHKKLVKFIFKKFCLRPMVCLWEPPALCTASEVKSQNGEPKLLAQPKEGVLVRFAFGV